MSTALVSRKKLANYRVPSERFLALWLLSLSFAGALLWGGGGVDAWLTNTVTWPGAIGAFVAQAGLTYIQWTHADQRWDSVYWRFAIVGSSALTVAGYWGLVHPTLTGLLMMAEVPKTTAPYIAGIFIVVVGFVADFAPEQILTGETTNE